MPEDADPDPTWNGNTYQNFVDLMAVEKLDDWTYRSIAKPFSPSAATAAYGGHVFAQSVYAASKTVKEGMVCCVCMPKVETLNAFSCYVFKLLLLHRLFHSVSV